MTPNFLFVGPDKSGSSWLFRVLSAHPEVYLSPAKDIYYFDRYFDRGDAWYFSRFSGAGPQHQVIGEICHDYLYSPEAPQRIRSTLGPDVHILMCLREPVDRAFSDYLNRVRSGSGAESSFTQTLDLHPEIVQSGMYERWVRGYLETFAADNVKIALFDDLKSEPQHFLNSITDWLGISRTTLSDDQRAPARAAATSRSPRLTRAVRRTASIARDLGLEGMVGRLKSSSIIESALYRTYGRRPDVSEEDAIRIRSAVNSDVLALSKLTASPIAQRWGYAE